MRMMITTALLLLLAVPSLATAPDPWIGKSRDELTTLLGEPNKTKRSKAGTTLTYKLARLEEGSIPPSGMSVIKVPGVSGMLGLSPGGTKMQVASTASDSAPDDKYGRGGGGDVDAGESHSVSWSKKDGVERSWDDRSAIRGRVTLKFTVDGSGQIVDWSVSPKKAAE